MGILEAIRGFDWEMLFVFSGSFALSLPQLAKTNKLGKPQQASGGRRESKKQAG